MQDATGEREKAARQHEKVSCLSLSRCAVRMCCKSARHWMTAAPYSTAPYSLLPYRQLHVGGQLLSFRCTEAITADSVIAYITRDDRTNISSVSSRCGAKRRGSLLFRPTVLWLGSRVVSVLDSGAEGPGFKSQSRRCRVTVLGKLFTPIVPLFTKQQNW